MTRAVLEILAIALVHGTVLAAATWLVARLLGRRLGPSVIAALWAVVLLKFVIPIGPAMPYSPSDLIEWVRDGDTGRGPLVLTSPGPTASPVAATAPITPWWPSALLGLWLTGAGVVLARAVLAQRRARRAAARLPAADPAALSDLTALAARVGAPVPAVRVSAGGAPFLVGVWRPLLVVPGPLLTAEPSVRAAALAHELTHLRRRDPYWAVLATVVRAAFFFFPVARWAVTQFEAAREAACDASALATTAVSPPAYARLLLAYAAAPSSTPAGGVGLAARGRRSLARRIDAALGAPARGRGLGPVGFLVVAAWATLALAGARPAAARHPASEVCVYSTQLALELLASFPEADRDGDGSLTRAEACDLQIELRRRGDDAGLAEAAPVSDDPATAWLSGRLCCNCDQGEGTSSAPTTSSGSSSVDPAIGPSSTCRDEEGALP